MEIYFSQNNSVSCGWALHPLSCTLSKVMRSEVPGNAEVLCHFKNPHISHLISLCF